MPGKTIRRHKSGKKNVTKKHKSHKHSSRKSMKSKSKMHKYKTLYGGATFFDILEKIKKNDIADVKFDSAASYFLKNKDNEETLMEALEDNTSITSLNLSNSDFDTNTVTAIINVIALNKNIKIVDLNLSELFFNHNLIMAIALLLKMSKTIKKLDLSNSNMDGHCQQLGFGIANNNSELKELNLSNCNINNKEYYFIIGSLTKKSFITVNLSNNKITDRVVKALPNEIKNHTINIIFEASPASPASDPSLSAINSNPNSMPNSANMRNMRNM